MTQLSLFSADLAGPAVDDLAGLLAAHGQLVTSAGATRISVVVAQPWRAEGLAVLVRDCGIGVETGRSEEGRFHVRSSASTALAPLRAAWTKGAVKAVPVGWVPGGRALRAWMLAAGRPDDAGFVLGLDPHAVDTHLPLAAALARAGLAATLLGSRGGGPGLRVSGRRRLLRLAETVGEAPAGAAAPGSWPDPDEIRLR